MIHLHGSLYQKEYNYGTGFEAYVAKGLYEFYENYDPQLDRIWICEKENRMCGFLLLQHRESRTAQLRYFITTPECRGVGLGKWLMHEFMKALEEMKYEHAYLWTTKELHAAANLYTRFGFLLTEEKSSDFFGKPVIEQRYDWSRI